MAYDMTAARRDPIARLDAWVIEELEALGRPRPRQAERPKRRREADGDTELVDLEPAANDDPLPMDENQFIQRVSEWLSGRPNADLILEEIWRNVVATDAGEDLGDDDPADGDLGEGDVAETRHAAEADDAEAADLEAEIPEGPAGDPDDGVGDEVQA